MQRWVARRFDGDAPHGFTATGELLNGQAYGPDGAPIPGFQQSVDPAEQERSYELLYQRLVAEADNAPRGAVDLAANCPKPAPRRVPRERVSRRGIRGAEEPHAAAQGPAGAQRAPRTARRQGIGLRAHRLRRKPSPQ